MCLILFFKSVNITLQIGLFSVFKSFEIASKSNNLALQTEWHRLLVILKNQRAEPLCVGY